MTVAAESRDLTLVRTRHCYDVVKDWRPEWRKDAATRVKSLPIAIRTQGLMVVLATLLKENTSYARSLSNAVAEWLVRRAPHSSLKSEDSQEVNARRLLEMCRSASRRDYLAAEWEAILFFEQVKLYADALVPSCEESA